MVWSFGESGGRQTGVLEGGFENALLKMYKPRRCAPLTVITTGPRAPLVMQRSFCCFSYAVARIVTVVVYSRGDRCELNDGPLPPGADACQS